MIRETTPATLKMVPCEGCGAHIFISSDLPPMTTMPCTKCGHPIMMPFPLRQFELRGIIASGGMGTVYRAMDTMLQREVAVKLMKKELAHDDTAVQSFEREARAMGALNHTNIIHIYTFDKHEEQLFIVMELADRGNMDRRIEAEGRLPELHVLDIGIKIASALDTALKHGLLHRDIKPGNILYNADGEPKLVDFGLAGGKDAGMAEDNAVWGTPEYVAPEKVQYQVETFLSDMYSLAATMYHGLIGRVPFEAPSIEETVAAQISMPPTPPNQVLPEITQGTSDAVIKAMSKNPADRFQSYDELIMELTACRSRLLIAHYQEPAPEQGTTGGEGEATS